MEIAALGQESSKHGVSRRERWPAIAARLAVFDAAWTPAELDTVAPGAPGEGFLAKLDVPHTQIRATVRRYHRRRWLWHVQDGSGYSWSGLTFTDAAARTNASKRVLKLLRGVARDAERALAGKETSPRGWEMLIYSTDKLR